MMMGAWIQVEDVQDGTHGPMRQMAVWAPRAASPHAACLGWVMVPPRYAEIPPGSHTYRDAVPHVHRAVALAREAGAPVVEVPIRPVQAHAAAEARHADTLMAGARQDAARRETRRLAADTLLYAGAFAALFIGVALTSGQSEPRRRNPQPPVQEG